MASEDDWNMPKASHGRRSWRLRGRLCVYIQSKQTLPVKFIRKSFYDQPSEPATLICRLRVLVFAFLFLFLGRHHKQPPTPLPHRQREEKNRHDRIFLGESLDPG